MSGHTHIAHLKGGNNRKYISGGRTGIILYANDTSIIITNPCPKDFKINMNEVFVDINEWFKINWLSLNFKRTHYPQFRAKNSQEINVNISYVNKHITNVASTKFLGLIIDETLSRKNRIYQLMSKLSSACCAVRTVKAFMSQESLRMIYLSYTHSIIIYGIILWGSSPYSINIFRIQKRLVRIITNSRNRGSCRKLFKNLKIIPLYLQYIFSLLLLLFVVKNKD